MAVSKDVREVINKRTGKLKKKTTWSAQGSYVTNLGKRKRYHKRGFETESAAKEWERQFLLTAKEETDSNMSFEDLYTLYLENRKSHLKERSYSDIVYISEKHLLPYWGKTKLTDITLRSIERWQKKVLSTTYERCGEQKTYGTKHLIRIQNQFKTVLRYGAKNGYINNMQLLTFTTARRNTEIKKEMLFWKPDEYQRFIQEINDHGYKALFEVLYWCGLRIGEALALSWNDISFLKKTITVSKTYDERHKSVTPPKTFNSNRVVIIPDKCLESLKAHYEQCVSYDGFSTDKFVFGYDRPYDDDDNTLRRKKNSACIKAGITQIRIHDFRHSHVSLLINLQFSAFDIAKRLGHTVEMVNNTYSHWFDDAQQKMVDRLNTI